MEYSVKQLFRNVIVNFPVILKCTLFVLPFVIYMWRMIDQLRSQSNTTSALSEKTMHTNIAVPKSLRLMEDLLPFIKTLSQRQRVGHFIYLCGNNYFRNGQLPIAEHCYQMAIQLMDVHGWRHMVFCRALGATLFMRAKLPEAHKALAAAGTTRKSLLAINNVSSGVRSLDAGWFVAIGHIAMIDFYVKRRLLGWVTKKANVAVSIDLNNQPGKLVAHSFRKHGIEFLPLGAFPDYYNQHKFREDKPWSELSEDEQRAMADSFWEYDFPDGEILTYTHGAAKIQNQWERENRPPRSPWMRASARR